jgi:outer membrane murein-binding lipoprotein Lpp
MRTWTVLLMAMCANVAVVAGCFALYLSYRARRKRPTLSDDQLAAEIRQIRESVDALTIEVERIGESQRFTARLLHEASTMRATFPAAPPKTITPH